MSYQITEKPMLSERVQRIKASFFETEVKVSFERVTSNVEAYEEAGGEPIVVTRAKAFDKYLREMMTLYIDENPIVGSLTQYRRGVSPSVDWADWVARETWTSYGKVEFSEEQQKIINNAADYFSDKNQAYRVKSIYEESTGLPEELLEIGGGRVAGVGISMPLGFANADYGKVINDGLEAIINETEQHLIKVSLGDYEDFRKRDFYRAVIISLNAVIAWANRYASLAEQMAQNETDTQRRRELEQIAETCRRVPAKPARTFYEAVQSFWFIHTAIWIEAAGIGFAPGRFTQYMYPFYEKDLAEGRISESDAIERLELLFIKFSEIGAYLPDAGDKGAKLHTANTVTLGGFTQDGKDATNELDFLVLEADKNVRMLQPSVVVMWHNKLSSEFLMKCAENVKMGLGKPAFVNGHIAVNRHLERWKCSLEEAYDISTVGCTQTAIAHATDGFWGANINLAKLLELTLNDGRDPATGEQVGLNTGGAEDFSNYEDLEEALEKQLLYFVRMLRTCSRIAANVDAEYLPTPFLSALIDDCLERGKDVLQGGARFGGDGDCMVGVVDASNSLAAIKKLVFEEKQITMQELLNALRANFEGHEAVHHALLKAPKYGNDDNYADEIVRRWYDIFLKEEISHKSHLGRDDLRPYGVVVALHNLFGLLTGALPSGRKAGIPLSDGTVSASPGTDINGPTALINSAVGAMDPTKYSSTIFNMKFHPAIMASNESLMKVLALVRTYMDLGGYHIQFNVVSADTLRQAQRNPAQFKDLVVRVAGFSAFFVQLLPKVQEEIIARTEQGLGE